MPGADVSFKMMISELKKFVKKNKNACLFESLGDELYFSLCKVVDLMIGNSSSGIIEMSSFKKGTINIGDRQKGRVMPESVLNVNFDEKKIKNKIKYAYSKKFNSVLKNVKNPYDQRNSSDKLIKILKKIKLKNILKKNFFNYKVK